MNIDKALAFKSTFETILNTEVAENYKDFFTGLGVPNGSKAGVVCDALRSLPYLNQNFMGFTEKVLENSYQTFVNSFVDLEHDQNVILGNIVKSELIKAENQPTIVRVCCVLWKDVLDDWYINDVMQEKWSMEAKTSQYAFIVNGNIVEWEKSPEKWRQSVQNWYDGIPVYDDFGNRIGLLLGGIDGTIDLCGLALLSWKNPADDLVKTHLLCANKKEGGNMINYTQEQLNEAVKVAKAEKDTEYSPKLQEFETKLQTANASIIEKDAKIKELETKLAEAELKVQAESNRAAIAEAEITKRDNEKRFEERKAALAAKNYPADMIEEEKEFIASASQEDFDKFVTKFEKLAVAMKSTKATASNNQQEIVIPNLTRTAGIDEKFNPFL